MPYMLRRWVTERESFDLFLLGLLKSVLTRHTIVTAFANLHEMLTAAANMDTTLSVPSRWRVDDQEQLLREQTAAILTG